MRLTALICVLAVVAFGDAIKVLVAIPGSIKSLSGLLGSIGNVLAEAGHEVVLITSFPPSKHNANMSIVHTTQFDHIWESSNVFHMRDIGNMSQALTSNLQLITPLIWQDQRIWELWRKRNTFDVIIVTSYMSEGVFPFLMDFAGQFVQIITPGIEFFSLSRSGNWMSPAVVPSILLNYDDQMTFWERVLNLPTVAYTYYLGNKMSAKIYQQLHTFFPNYTRFDDVYNQVDLSLINGHFTLDGPVPLLPNQVEIGTINARKPAPLPKHLQEFVRGAGKHGLIYFSLGSIAKSSDIPSYAKAAFVEAFRRIPQRVVWKYEGDDISASANVLTSSWMPQQDILGHANTRVFISHCGNLGTQEAKFHGVPVLGLPIAFDQHRNCARMQRKGLAVLLTWEELTADTLVLALNQLINDTSYKERLEQISRISQDQKESPAERAVWWVEYMVRHKGAPQLQYAGKNMFFFQYVMLDVLLFWTVVLSAVVLLFVKTIGWLCCSKRPSMQKIKNKKA